MRIPIRLKRPPAAWRFNPMWLGRSLRLPSLSLLSQEGNKFQSHVVREVAATGGPPCQGFSAANRFQSHVVREVAATPDVGQYYFEIMTEVSIPCG